MRGILVLALCALGCKEKASREGIEMMTFTCGSGDRQCFDMMRTARMSGGPVVFTIAAIELSANSATTLQDIDAFCSANNWTRRVPRNTAGRVVVLQTPYDVPEEDSRDSLARILCPGDWVTFYYYEDYRIHFSSFNGSRQCSTPIDAGAHP